MAAKIPGIKNIWLKTERNQIRDFSGVYIIEFTSAEAAADYAESPIHEVWRKKWEQLRENSLSFPGFQLMEDLHSPRDAEFPA